MPYLNNRQPVGETLSGEPLYGYRTPGGTLHLMRVVDGKAEIYDGDYMWDPSALQAGDEPTRAETENELRDVSVPIAGVLVGARLGAAAGGPKGALLGGLLGYALAGAVSETSKSPRKDRKTGNREHQSFLDGLMLRNRNGYHPAE